MTEQFSGQDPSLHAGTALSDRELDPNVLLMATNPGQLSEAERHQAFQEAALISAQSSLHNTVAIHDREGHAYKAVEYPEAFTFTGSIRSTVDRIPKDVSQWTNVEGTASMAGFGSRHTNVLIETDDGEQYLIRRTSDDVKSAALQTFEVVSTTQEAKRAPGEPKTGRPIGTDMLAQTVVVPGQRMVLGAMSSSPLRTRGRVTRVTSFSFDEASRIDPQSRRLNELPQSDAVAKFSSAMHSTL